MSATSLLSVITVTYQLVENKRTDVFRQALESVRALRHLCPVEHLIKDGGSMDGSMELYQAECSDCRVISEPDGGIYDAMNQAAANATGKYLAFLNSDDYYHDPAGMVELLEELERNNADYGYAGVRRIKRDGSIEERKAKMYSVFARMPYCHQTLIIRRELFLQMGGYDTAFKIVGDHEFALRLYLAKASAVYRRTPFVTFRSGGASGDKEKNHLERAAVFRKLYSRYYPASEKEWKKIASNRSFPFALFRKLLTVAPRQNRPELLHWFLLYRLKLLFR